MKTSVLINNFNNAPYVADCLESVLQQTQPADEIIFYDDGSSDESRAIVQKFGHRVKLIAGVRPPAAFPAHVNQGRAIHEAFRASRGDLVFLLDSDDTFHPTRIARYMESFMRQPAATLVQAPLTWIDETGNTLPRLAEPFKHNNEPLAATYVLQDPDFFYPTSALAFPRSFLSVALPIDWSDEVPLWSDTRLSLAALLAGPIVTLPEELGAWRKYSRSNSARSNSRSYLVRQTWRRTRVFNDLASQVGLPSISLWRNARFYLRLLRLAAPRSVFAMYRSRFRPIVGASRISPARSPRVEPAPRLT